MTLIYDEQLSVLDDSFEGSEVSILATRGRTVDKAFRRNYAWAKHAADAGKLTKISVYVNTDGTDVVHSVTAVASALTGTRLHDVAEFEVQPANTEQVPLAQAIAAGLKELAAQPKPVKQERFVSGWANLDVAAVANKEAAVTPVEDVTAKQFETKEGISNDG